MLGLTYEDLGSLLTSMDDVIAWNDRIMSDPVVASKVRQVMGNTKTGFISGPLAPQNYDRTMQQQRMKSMGIRSTTGSSFAGSSFGPPQFSSLGGGMSMGLGRTFGPGFRG